MKLKERIHRIKLKLDLIRISLAVYYLTLALDLLIFIENDRRQVEHMKDVIYGYKGGNEMMEEEQIEKSTSVSLKVKETEPIEQEQPQGFDFTMNDVFDSSALEFPSIF